MKFAYFRPAQPYTLATCVYSVDEMIPIWCIKGALNFNTVTQMHIYTGVHPHVHTRILRGMNNNAYKMLYSGSKRFKTAQLVHTFDHAVNMMLSRSRVDYCRERMRKVEAAPLTLSSFLTPPEILR